MSERWGCWPLTTFGGTTADALRTTDVQKSGERLGAGLYEAESVPGKEYPPGVPKETGSGSPTSDAPQSVTAAAGSVLGQHRRSWKHLLCHSHRGDGEEAPFAGHALELVSATLLELNP
jgi:hypothetical protein